MKRNLITLLLTIPLFISAQHLSWDQHYVIPEQAENNDSIGKFHYLPYLNGFGESATFSIIAGNTGNAIGLNSEAMLYVANSSVIDAGTDYDLTIKATKGDTIEYFHAYIAVAPQSKCVFIDPNWTGSESGTKSNPYNHWKKDIQDKEGFQPGYYYFQKRGTSYNANDGQLTFRNINTNLNAKVILGAYGKGTKPEINGNTVSEGSTIFSVGFWDTSEENSGQYYVEFYDLYFETNYTNANYCIKIQGEDTRHIKLHRLDFQGGDENSPVYIYGNYYHYTEDCGLYFCSSDSSWGYGFKDSGEGSEIIGCTVTRNGLAGAHQTGISTNWRTGKLLYGNYLDYGKADDSGRRIGIEVNSPNTKVIKSFIKGYHRGLSCDADTWQPQLDNLLISEAYLTQYSRANFDASLSVEDSVDNSVFERIYIENALMGIRTRPKSNNNIFRNIIINDAVEDGIQNDGAGNKYYNVTIYDIGGKGIDLIVPTEISNCIYPDLSGKNTGSNNLPTSSSAIFTDAANGDFSLDSNATSAINQGTPDVGVTVDYFGLTRGPIPDIGACEYIKGEHGSNNSPSNSAPYITTEEVKYLYTDANSSFVGTIEAIDEDEDKITFSLISADSDLFKISSSDGQITCTNPDRIDPINSNEFNLLVRVYDNSGQDHYSESLIRIQVVPDFLVFYINPDTEETIGLDGSKEKPFKSWSEVKWIEGANYVQKSGTEAVEEKILIAANNITMGSYDQGKSPIIRSLATDYALKFYDKKNVMIRNLHINASEAIAGIYFFGDECDNNIIENCYLEGSKYGLRMIEGKSFTSRYNTFKTIIDGIYSYCEYAEIYYNIFKGAYTAINLPSYNASAKVYNNVFFDNRQGISTSYAELEVFNNIFYMPSSGDQAINHELDKLVSNHNIFYPEQDGFLSINKTEYNNLNDYQNSLAQDMNSNVTDPQFVDIYDKDFSLKTGSPAIDAGKKLDIMEDILGQSVPCGNAPDIGAIECLHGVTSNKPKEEDELIQISVFPNPSSGIFQLNMQSIMDEISHIAVYNSSGVQVLQEAGFGEKQLMNFDLTTYPDGIYFVHVSCKNSSHSIKIIKK